MKTTQYIPDIKQIIISARDKTYTAINTAMVEACWLISKKIINMKHAVCQIFAQGISLILKYCYNNSYLPEEIIRSQ